MLPFSSLTPAQVAQVESSFRDPEFGSDPAAYLYELTDGQLTGQRTRVEIGTFKYHHSPLKTPVTVMTSGPIILDESAVKFLARRLLELSVTVTVPSAVTG